MKIDRVTMSSINTGCARLVRAVTSGVAIKGRAGHVSITLALAMVQVCAHVSCAQCDTGISRIHWR